MVKIFTKSSGHRLIQIGHGIERVICGSISRIMIDDGTIEEKSSLICFQVPVGVGCLQQLVMVGTSLLVGGSCGCPIPSQGKRGEQQKHQEQTTCRTMAKHPLNVQKALAIEVSPSSELYFSRLESIKQMAVNPDRRYPG